MSPTPLERFEPLCRWIVRDRWAPGLERDDLMQEARLAVLLALRTWEGGRGASLHSFVRMVVQRRVDTAVRTATRRKHEPVSGAVTRMVGDDGEVTDALELVPDRTPGPHEQLELADELRSVGARALMLSDVERASLGGMLDGRPYTEIAARAGTTRKGVDNGIQRARRKLAA